MQPPTVVWPGRGYPLGATWDGEGVNFALYSANATDVELAVFDASGRRELKRFSLPERTDNVWHGYLRDPGGHFSTIDVPGSTKTALTPPRRGR